MSNLTKTFYLFAIIFFISCSENSKTADIIVSDSSKVQVKEISITKPKADIKEFEMEINNGGFSQYLINSSSQNCFETLRHLKIKGKTKTANLLEQALSLINPRKLSEQELIEKLKKQEVTELYDDKIIEKLNKLDELFYKNPDGNLE